MVTLLTADSSEVPGLIRQVQEGVFARHSASVHERAAAFHRASGWVDEELTRRPGQLTDRHVRRLAGRAARDEVHRRTSVFYAVSIGAIVLAVLTSLALWFFPGDWLVSMGAAAEFDEPPLRVLERVVGYGRWTVAMLSTSATIWAVGALAFGVLIRCTPSQRATWIARGRTLALDSLLIATIGLLVLMVAVAATYVPRG
ncbi:hypothetical protein FOS14_19550 [Skermania sp. ID1734]|uniref:hypothetical protein n=1 Tax=Skermania sp. ID1734 TaxID=2597516 RepID=UPI00117EBF26|nr:hypothetical protein [Skermania sp. ID1734]TSD94839.1 hypothetical protein FOS14_19550 [Skermania sp. ID1734]